MAKSRYPRQGRGGVPRRRGGQHHAHAGAGQAPRRRTHRRGRSGGDRGIVVREIK